MLLICYVLCRWSGGRAAVQDATGARGRAARRPRAARAPYGLAHALRKVPGNAILTMIYIQDRYGLNELSLRCDLKVLVDVINSYFDLFLPVQK